MEITVKMDIKEFEEYLLFRDKDKVEETRAEAKIRRIIRDLKENNPGNYHVETLCEIILRELAN